MTGSTARSPLGTPFRQLWVASGVSNLGDGIVLVALTLAAARLTTSATLIVGVAIAQQLPGAIAALPAGAIADRVDRRRLMLAANVVRAVTVAAAATIAAAGLLSIPVIYVVGFVMGASSVLVDATAQSTVPMLVGRDQLAAANGRLAGAQIAAQEFLGAPLAGVLVAIAVALAFAAPAVLYAAAALALLAMRGDYIPRRRGPTLLRADIVEGLRYLAGHRLLRTVAAMSALANVAASGFFAVFVLFVVGPRSAMDLSEPGYGALFAVLAAGAVAGAATAERVERRLGRVRMLKATVTGWALCFAVPAITADVVAVGAAMFAAGYVNMLASVILVSLRQTIVPREILGRVNATMRLVGTGAAPIGAAIAGVVADSVGLRAVFLGASALAVLTLPGFLVITERALTDAEHDPRAPIEV